MVPGTIGDCGMVPGTLVEAHFSVFAEHSAECICDFADGGPRFDRGNDRRHEVVRPFRGVSDLAGFEAGLRFNTQAVEFGGAAQSQALLKQLGRDSEVLTARHEVELAKAELELRLVNSTSVDSIEREARRIGYVKPGERLFVVKGIPAWRKARSSGDGIRP